MIRRFKYIIIILLAAVVYDSSAQNSQVLYYMNLPQRHLLNPALRPSNSVYIGLPAISGINLNINNNFFNFSDVLSQSGDSLITIFHPDYDIEDFIKKIKDVNAIEPQVMIQLFGLGFKAGKDLYIFLDINERIEANVALPGDLLRLGFQGNESFIGSKIDLSSLRTDIMWYREAGLGFSKNFTNNLRLGVKGKLLFGMATASTDIRSLGITVTDDYSHIFDADMTVNLSAPGTVNMDTDNNIEDFEFDSTRFDKTSKIVNYLLKPGNIGLGLDIGAEYTFTDRLRASAAITDLGFIKWKRDITNLQAESRFDFSGIDLLDQIVCIDSSGKEKKLHEIGASTELSLSAGDNVIVWDEIEGDPRWEGRSYSVVKSFDRHTGRERTLERKTRYFSPDISSDESKIVAVEADIENNYFLIVLRYPDGKLLHRIPAPGTMTLQYPRWVNDHQVVLIGFNGKEKSIELANTVSGEWNSRFHAGNMDIAEPEGWRDYILFRASCNGIDNVVAIDTNGTVFQITSAQFGAFYPSVTRDSVQLVYSSYTSNGFELVKIPLDTVRWTRLHRLDDPASARRAVERLRAAARERGAASPSASRASAAGGGHGAGQNSPALHPRPADRADFCRAAGRCGAGAVAAGYFRLIHRSAARS